jgi:predicted nuclease with TOPRIM domain
MQPSQLGLIDDLLDAQGKLEKEVAELKDLVSQKDKKIIYLTDNMESMRELIVDRDGIIQILKAKVDELSSESAQKDELYRKQNGEIQDLKKTFDEDKQRDQEMHIDVLTHKLEKANAELERCQFISANQSKQITDYQIKAATLNKQWESQCRSIQNIQDIARTFPTTRVGLEEKIKEIVDIAQSAEKQRVLLNDIEKSIGEWSGEPVDLNIKVQRMMKYMNDREYALTESKNTLSKIAATLKDFCNGETIDVTVEKMVNLCLDRGMKLHHANIRMKELETIIKHNETIFGNIQLQLIKTKKLDD